MNKTITILTLILALSSPFAFSGAMSAEEMQSPSKEELAKVKKVLDKRKTDKDKTTAEFERISFKLKLINNLDEYSNVESLSDIFSLIDSIPDEYWLDKLKNRNGDNREHRRNQFQYDHDLLLQPGGFVD